MLVRSRGEMRGAGDEGFSMAEVLAAMLIFALLSVGLLHTLLSIMTVSRDARARQVATNLASAQVDRAREKTNLFDLLNETHTETVDDIDYTVSMTSQWVSDPSVTLNCGAGGGVLRYKRINVEVTWPNMRASTKPVRADTLINPDTRINDATKGTILVSVLNGEGAGSAGVSVSATPISGGAGVPSVTTDAEGCAYLLQVEPGNYRIKVARTGYVDVDQQADPAVDVTVTAGNSVAASFQYDLAADFTAHLASNAASAVAVPKDMDVSFVSTYGTSVMSGPTGQDRTFALHPFASGYSAFAGTCAAADPQLWPARTDGTNEYVGERPAALAVAPGGSATIDVPMGIVQLSAAESGKYLRAVAESDPAGEHPGCTTTVELHFDPVWGVPTIALPYGSWSLYSGTWSSQTTVVSTMTPLTEGRVDAGVLTLDPRTVVVP